MQQVFYGHTDLVKISLSMARLLTVVNERKRIRNLYRASLEDEYIASRKAEEKELFLEAREKMKAAGETNLPMLPEEVKQMLQDRTARKHEELKQ